MTTSTSTVVQTGSSSGTVTVRIPTGEELYNALMSEIEPELLTFAIPTLEQAHAGETPGEHATRIQRYKEAYRKYDEVYERWMLKFGQLVAQYRRQALKMRETAARSEETQAMDALEQKMSGFRSTDKA
jgi:hypothetical protein